ncbi:deferrochelatase/peroxidase EfeB [Lampropedia hyalina DSM 16112]|jgi:deferrochelatase/peroxidase EfeB|uniref:Deferrochelatase n=1 Tax=Lampropedia hyalina DSM 16112 TaxID=1122156 RepID=A0A1M5EY94_9BURK|nr:iron uptake transporter deferrochelatase/peroxidase subunit [Lampropedia hyalina]SHF83951.1 deferrochelatase/peroxidase EfeB [Lampropedia hyalina DSM 16112]
MTFPTFAPVLPPDSPADAAPASRRQVLRTLGWSVAALGAPWGLTACTTAPASHAVQGGKARGTNVTNAPVANTASMQDRVAFFGPHQAGVTTPRPAHGMIASFAVLAETPDELERLLRRLTERCQFLTQGGTPPELHPQLPPAGSGILGPVIQPDALTITVSLGSSLFDDRPWLAPLKPRRLSRMTRFPNDALDAALCHGDLSLQICANTQDTTLHALRDIIKNLSGQLVPRWKQQGNVPVIQPLPDGRVENARNFLGFRDGSANPDANDDALMNRVVWVGAGRGEPDWAHGGSYQAVRIIRNFVERWDRTPLREQEQVFGRTKMSGAPLDQIHASEFEVPDYTRDPDGEATPHDAHIRLANPRTPESDANLMLRRPFNYSNGIVKNGQLDQGLLFICYQADLEQGFIAVQRRLDGEPLEEYIKPIGGGYFYTLPGVRDASDYLGSSLVAAARTIFSSTPKG